MKDKELLIEAIENYDLFTLHEKTILKLLIELSIDNKVVCSIIKLKEISQISRPTIYRALQMFEDYSLIDIEKNPNRKISTFILKDHKLKEIISHHLSRKNILNIMKK